MAYEIFNTGDKIPKSKYKGVSCYLQQKKYIVWSACKSHKNKKYKKEFDNEREAALGYDKMCLSLGLSPVNILVKK